MCELTIKCKRCNGRGVASNRGHGDASIDVDYDMGLCISCCGAGKLHRNEVLMDTELLIEGKEYLFRINKKIFIGKLTYIGKTKKIPVFLGDDNVAFPADKATAIIDLDDAIRAPELKDNYQQVLLSLTVARDMLSEQQEKIDELQAKNSKYKKWHNKSLERANSFLDKNTESLIDAICLIGWKRDELKAELATISDCIEPLARGELGRYMNAEEICHEITSMATEIDNQHNEILELQSKLKDIQIEQIMSDALFDLVQEKAQEWQGKCFKLQAENKQLHKALNFHPRAAKLMHKQKNFLVVAYDEPYFDMVYKTIRAEEMKKGTWNSEDEQKYLDATQGVNTDENKNK